MKESKSPLTEKEIENLGRLTVEISKKRDEYDGVDDVVDAGRKAEEIIRAKRSESPAENID